MFTFVNNRTSNYQTNIIYRSDIDKEFFIFRAFLPFAVSFLRYVESIMITINSSINFIIYYVLGESFRNEARRMAREFGEFVYKIQNLF